MSQLPAAPGFEPIDLHRRYGRRPGTVAFDHWRIPLRVA